MKPILFNTDMVRAILDGRKTVTRRVVKEISTKIYCQVEGNYDHEFIRDDFADGVYTGFVCRKCGYGVSPPHGKYPVGESCIRPPYHPGDILYVRETCQKVQTGTGPWRWVYRADMEDPRYFDDGFFATWRPSIHMPREAARIFLRVTDVRVERLQESGKGWCLEIEKEGICTPQDPILYISDDAFHDALRKEMEKVWDSTIKPADRDKYGWDANPWVFVVSFTKITKEEAENAQ